MKIKSIKKQSEEITPEKARIIARLMGDGALYKTGSDYTAKGYSFFL